MIEPPPLVCIVDDDESVREALAGLLRSAGLRPATFASAQDYLRAGLLECTDCLILDVHMPGMNGHELQLELIARRASVPSIVISGRVDESTRAEAGRNGARCFMTKPLDDEALLREIHAACASRETNA